MPYPLEKLGLKNTGEVYFNLKPAVLYEHALRRDEGVLIDQGPIRTETGQYTGRSPNDRYVVKEASCIDKIAWGKINVPISEEVFDTLLERRLKYFEGKEIFVQDCFAGADPNYRIKVRAVNENAWHNMFAYNMFVRAETEKELEGFVPEWTILHAPADVAKDYKELGLNSEAFVIVNLAKQMVLIAGTPYAGEMKKSIFSVMNYLLPEKGVLPMHCSANIGDDGVSALFFGLSGTGKTTLSADKTRGLIGDDEHGWSDDGVFNFEGGCYAKVIKLSPEAEPDIWDCTRSFGTILENVIYDKDRKIDLDDGTLTENTRASYPITSISNHVPSGMGGHPKNVILLTADAFGVMPPISKLTSAQAMYHFIAGYTAKLAGTERGVTEPKAAFSACFGEPFLPLPPAVYAEMLGKKLEKHGANCWLVNTGWTGGPYGVGHRMEIKYTRAMLHAALEGELEKVEFEEEPFFGLFRPKTCPNVPDEVLNPKLTWKDKEAYDTQAKVLAAKFRESFKKYEESVTPEILDAAPKG